MYRNDKKLKSKKLSKFLKLFFVIFLITATLLFIRSDFFKIRKIEIKSEKIGCSSNDQIRQSLNLLGQNIFFINGKIVTENIKEKFICIKNVNLSNSLPETVKVVIFGREAIAILITLTNEEASPSSLLENIATPSAQDIKESYVIDNEGVIFSKNKDNLKIPKIYLYRQEISLGSRLNNNIVDKALKILDKVTSFGVNIVDSWLNNNFFLINSINGSRIIFSVTSDIDIQLASLQLILQKAKIDERRLEFIDLRFDKPVVKFAPKK